VVRWPNTERKRFQMSKLLGSHVSIQFSCPYGCCTPYGKPSKKNLKALKRSAKRSEDRNWKKEN
jgi:hypothetical protein